MTYSNGMRLFAIGDTHLSRARPKPMDIFGEHWADHDEHIRRNWNAEAGDDDILMVAGDVSWAMRLDEALPDLEFLATFRGRMLLLKGNHDYWWGSIARMKAAAPDGIDFLQNDARAFDGVAVAGTRGWILPNSPGETADDRRVFLREVARLRLSIEAALRLPHQALIVMTHYPPLRSLGESTPLSDLIESAGAAICVYGHLHGRDIATAAEGIHNGVRYKLVSADAVGFRPWAVWPPPAWPALSPR